MHCWHSVSLMPHLPEEGSWSPLCRCSVICNCSMACLRQLCPHTGDEHGDPLHRQQTCRLAADSAASRCVQEWCRGQMQTLLNTSELTFPYYLMTLEGRNLLDEAVLANLRGTTTEAQRRAFTSEFFRSAAAL